MNVSGSFTIPESGIQPELSKTKAKVLWYFSASIIISSKPSNSIEASASAYIVFDILVDISLSSYGIGSHHTLSDTIDLVIDASIIDVKVGSSSSDGVGIQLGTIYRINEYFSILVGINYIKMEGESDSEFAFGAAYVMPINKELSLGASIAIVDDASTTSVGLEYKF